MRELIRTCLEQGLNTERLFLRKLRLEDAKDMFEYTSSAVTCRYLTWGPHKERDEAQAFIYKAFKKYEAAQEILWGIEEKQDQKLIGVVRIYELERQTAKVSYILNERYTGKGYMTEAIGAVIQCCFDCLEVHAVVADYVEGNEQSKRVMERCGMVPVERPPIPVFIKDKAMLLYQCRIQKGPIYK